MQRDGGLVVLSLMHLQSVFIVLGLGFVLAAIALFTEIFLDCFKRRERSMEEARKTREKLGVE